MFSVSNTIELLKMITPFSLVIKHINLLNSSLNARIPMENTLHVIPDKYLRIFCDGFYVTVLIPKKYIDYVTFGFAITNKINEP